MNGVAIGPAGQVWGPVTRRIADAYQRFVDHDFVGQYLKRYIEGDGGAGVLADSPQFASVRPSPLHRGPCRRTPPTSGTAPPS